MAQKVLIEIVDDLDGEAAAQTVPFALDGVSYEIDLSEENAVALREELARYMEAGQRTGGRRIKVAVGQTIAGGGRASAASVTDRERNQQVRAWAAANGYAIGDRGRIPNGVYTAFDDAELAASQAAAEPVDEAPAKPARKRASRKKK